ncbi:oligoribonuclease [Stylonychia lemnae]|uniref:Oligoribonuclease n=1 Tax=Stylonychia lemnae TaxID=5949 RepID=A0A078AH36_STYLE|nr:oligoribonuclease [Stylonychia lemnae]|eukprot:CDW81554.1 oligoribonuclease [Stylonychia lemnae]
MEKQDVLMNDNDAPKNPEIQNQNNTKPIQEVKEKQNSQIFNAICFLELEYTDPDPNSENCRICEISIILMNQNLTQSYPVADYIIDTNPEFVTDPYVKQRLVSSGLWNDMQDPNKCITLTDAEQLIIQQLQEYKILKGSTPSAGIQAYQDRILTERFMPELDKFLNFMQSNTCLIEQFYRIIDISSLDDVAERFNKNAFRNKDQNSKPNLQRTQYNIQKAINRLRNYKKSLLKSK